MKISKVVKKAEAVDRMRRMDIIEDAIIQFHEEDTVMVSENPFGFLFWLNAEQKKLVKEFEEEYNGLVYLANLCNTEFGKLLSLFYVSDHEEEWDMENEDIESGYAMVYCINMTYPDLSEFGTISFQSVNGGIRRNG